MQVQYSSSSHCKRGDSAAEGQSVRHTLNPVEQKPAEQLSVRAYPAKQEHELLTYSSVLKCYCRPL